MAGVTTKKRNGDMGVQLTFPANFQKAYDMANEYFPSFNGSSIDLMIGTDFQSNYHEQKRRDANQSVMNGLQARRTMEQKLLTGPHNYHLPKPVLGQRRYANPMCGAESYTSTRRDNGPEAPFQTIEVGRGGGMRGGVVTSLEGQQFYQKQLSSRISQLNRINALAQGYAVEMGQHYKTDDNTTTGSVDKVQFFVYLRALMDTITEGDISRFTFENLKELMQLMFRFGPTMSIEDIDDTRDALDLMIVSIRDGLSEQPSLALDPQRAAYTETLAIFSEKMREYINAIESNFNLQLKDKITLSNSLKKSLGFERLIRKNSDVYSILREERTVNSRADTNVEDFDTAWGDDGDDGDDGKWDLPAFTREDDEAFGMPRAPFAGRSDDPNRKRYGERTGVLTGETSYFGESQTQARDASADMFPQYVAPLALSGADPNAVSTPSANPDVLAEAALDEINIVLQPLGYVSGTNDTAEFITANYPNPSLFVNEVASGLEEKGFSKQQIAEGMKNTDLSVFATYISENGGDLAPPPIRQSIPSGVVPFGGLAPPIYRDDDEDGFMDAAPPQAVGQRGMDPTTKEGKTELLRMYGFPLTRQDMYRKAKTESQYKQLGLLLPPELGGPYRMRAGTSVKSAKARIITMMKENYDPEW
jgi:hypothetical protein